MEDCIDAFTTRVGRNNGGPTGFKGFFHKFKKLKARHKIASEIDELKARAMELITKEDEDSYAQLKVVSLVGSGGLEDYEIDKQQLINRWAAEEFIHEEQGRRTYEVGERYFHDLIDRSLIQPVDVKYGQVEVCRVHDIILDFIACKAAEENFVTSLDTADFGKISDRKPCYYSVPDLPGDQAFIEKHFHTMAIEVEAMDPRN
ncbi:hypothetical protein E2562_000418 [Oryza meyeriana var. granulata]|uniref:Disease resistance protein winged helix domain-containing protein n=1 Tax=Oryza meyeriana var. granulata TaxID=110450 RepID=A0A6G1CC15_9ORYZ|nr:hypothetical protein E2562_000418 [Oryza meyeriana var. granulata]